MNDRETSTAIQQPIPGRACGSCMLCCKLPAIASLDKPMGKWCLHAAPGAGCASYEKRPGECREFLCDWLLDPGLGPDWKPDRAKFYVHSAQNGGLNIMVDPGSPAAWRDAHYYPAIKTAAARLLVDGRNVFVLIGRRVVVVFPDRDVDMGAVPDGHCVRTFSHSVNGRMVWDARIERTAPSVQNGEV